MLSRRFKRRYVLYMLHSDGNILATGIQIPAGYLGLLGQSFIPWRVKMLLRLEAQPWRIGEGSCTAVKACPVEGTWNEDRTVPKVPLCATILPTSVEASRPIEIQGMRKFGRDSNWPLKVTAASGIDEFTSLSLTFDIGWDNFRGNPTARS
jgi:hypothetical protein